MTNNRPKPHTEVIVSSLPKCDLSASHGDAKYDAKTIEGPWAFLCEGCFRKYGMGLGLGRGQRLVQSPDNP